MSGYLAQLTIELATGIEAVPLSFRKVQTDFFLSRQNQDGAFVDREGKGDLYYTSFALRALAILGELEGEVAEKTAYYLRSSLGKQTHVVDFFSLIYSGFLLEASSGIDVFSGAKKGWQTAIATWLENLKRPDGGYAKATVGSAGSTYHTFLVLLCLELLNQPVQNPPSILKFLEAQEDPSGGYREIRVSTRAGTNPTAAAIAVYEMLFSLTGPIKTNTAQFLLEMETDEGGLRANTRIPIADLLSTFTGALTLARVDAWHELEVDRLEGFLSDLAQPTGGFIAAHWDTTEDVEYSFYGLATMALIAYQQNRSSSPS
ncbi:MAG: beta-hydroxylase [Pirellulaceae bacterium]|nr:beta-hydroxylase [Pirellulaceae bacterium]